MTEKPSPQEIEQGLRTGYTFAPGTPGLQEAARQLIRPIIDKMGGREIVYVCHFPRLVRVDHLEVDDQGFRAVGTPTHELGDQVYSVENGVRRWEDKPLDPRPLRFGMPWHFLRMSGGAICMNMISDCFYPDERVVGEVKAAVARNAIQEISAILTRASSKG